MSSSDVDPAHSVNRQPRSAAQPALPTATMPTTDSIPFSHWQPTSDLDPDHNADIFRESSAALKNSCAYYSDETADEIINNFNQTSDLSPLSIMHYNVRGISSNHRYNELEMFINSKPLSIVGLCETFLQNNNCALYQFTGFNSIHKPRSDGRNGGGVSLLIKESLNYIQRTDLPSLLIQCESIFIELPATSQSRKSTVIGEIYRPPDGNKSAFIEGLETLLNKIEREGKTCYIMGDINIDLMKCDSDPNALEYISTYHRHLFFPLINRPTRLASKTLLDHIFTNSRTCLRGENFASGVVLFDMSDHCPVFHVINSSTPSQNSSRTEISFQLINEHSIAELKALLRSMDWSDLLSLEDVNSCYEKFNEMFSKAYFQCIKIIHRQERPNHKPWITTALKKSIKKKNQLYALSIKTPCDFTRSRYRSYRNKLNHLLRIAERDYARAEIDKHSSDLKKHGELLTRFSRERTLGLSLQQCV